MNQFMDIDPVAWKKTEDAKMAYQNELN